VLRCLLLQPEAVLADEGARQAAAAAVASLIDELRQLRERDAASVRDGLPMRRLMCRLQTTMCTLPGCCMCWLVCIP